MRPIWDLPQFYFAAKLIRAGKISLLYDKSAYVPLNAELAKSDPLAAKYSTYFNRPAFEAPLFLPLAFLSYRAAGILVLIVNFGLLALLVWRIPKWLYAPRDSRIWLFVFMPFLHSIAFGQDTLLLTLLVAFGLHLLLDKQDIPSGAVLALAVFKPHLLCAVPFALIAGKKWKALCSFMFTAGALALVSFTIVGIRGIRNWAELLRAPSTDAVPLLMGNLRALGLHCGTAAAFAAASWALACFVIALRYSPFLDKFAAALLAGLLFSPHTYLQDYSLAAIIGLIALYPGTKYLLLLPWPYFYPFTDLLPFILLGLACLTCLAARPVILRWNEWCLVRKTYDIGLEGQGRQPVLAEECMRDTRG